MPRKRKSEAEIQQALNKSRASNPEIRIIKQPDLTLTPEEVKKLTDLATSLGTVSQSLLDKEWHASNSGALGGAP